MEHTCTVEIIGREFTQTLTGNLILFSAWFQVEPFPDDHWRITVKSEYRGFIEKYGEIV